MAKVRAVIEKGGALRLGIRKSGSTRWKIYTLWVCRRSKSSQLVLMFCICLKMM